MSTKKDKFLPKGIITLDAYYIVQYWDNWGIENGEYKPPDKREYAIHSGPYSSYLDAVLNIMELTRESPTSKYDVYESKISGKVLGFDIDGDEF